MYDKTENNTFSKRGSIQGYIPERLKVLVCLRRAQLSPVRSKYNTTRLSNAIWPVKSTHSISNFLVYFAVASWANNSHSVYTTLISKWSTTLTGVGPMYVSHPESTHGTMTLQQKKKKKIIHHLLQPTVWKWQSSKSSALAHLVVEAHTAYIFHETA